MQKRWQESSLANTDANRAKLDAKKAEELAKIDALERTYWKAWRRSCKDREVQTAEKVTGDTARSKAATRREGQSGNPAFLAGVERCIDRRCKLLGLDAPRKLEHKHTLAAEDLTDEQLLAIAGSRPDRARGSGPGTPPPRTARKNLLDFTLYTMPGYDANWHHRVLCSYLDRWMFGDIRRLMVFMPPQHGKSEQVSRRCPAKIMGDIPTARLVTASYSADLASKMNRDVQKIMDTPQYTRLYPDTQLGGRKVRAVSSLDPLRNRDEFELLDRDGNFTGGSYKCAGVGGGISGRPMDFGIIDDPIKGREEAESPAVRETVWGWYTGDFLSRTHNDTRLLLTATRWNPDDLPGQS